MSIPVRIMCLAACVVTVGCQSVTPPSAVQSAASPSQSAQSALPSGTSSSSGLLTLTSDPEALVPPGDYQSSVPEMTFTVPEPSADEQWYGNASSTGWGIRLGSDPCDGCERGHLVVGTISGSVDEALEEWQSLADSRIETPNPVTLGGLDGVEFVGQVPFELDVAIVHEGYNPHGLVHVYLLDHAGTTVLVVADQYERNDTFLQDAQEVIDSFVFVVD